MDGRHHSAPLRQTVASYTQRPAITGTRGDISSPPRVVSTLGLARERLNLDGVGLQQNVIVVVVVVVYLVG